MTTGTAQQQVTQVQTAHGGQQQQPQGQARLLLGQLPGGKLVLQGSQLAALTQARAGGQPKVLTIQLQVQQQPNQQGGIKVRKNCVRFGISHSLTQNRVFLHMVFDVFTVTSFFLPFIILSA